MSANVRGFCPPLLKREGGFVLPSQNVNGVLSTPIKTSGSLSTLSFMLKIIEAGLSGVGFFFPEFVQAIRNLHMLHVWNCKENSIQLDCVDQMWRLIRIYTVTHFVTYHSKWSKAWSDIIKAIWRLIWVYAALMLLMLFFFVFFLFVFFHDTTHIAYSKFPLSEQKIMSVKMCQ